MTETLELKHLHLEAIEASLQDAAAHLDAHVNPSTVGWIACVTRDLERIARHAAALNLLLLADELRREVATLKGANT